MRHTIYYIPYTIYHAILHYTTLHYTTLHDTTLHYAMLCLARGAEGGLPCRPWLGRRYAKLRYAMPCKSCVLYRSCV